MPGPGAARTASRVPGETAEQFVQRHAPAGATMVHKLIDTEAWTPGKRAYIAFFELPPPPADSVGDVAGLLFLPVGPDRYRLVEIDRFGPEGRTAEIDSVFFAAVRGAPGRSLFVLVSWRPNPGPLYRTHAYRAPPSGSLPAKLDPLDIGLRLDGNCVYCRKQAWTAADVRRRIAAQGW